MKTVLFISILISLTIVFSVLSPASAIDADTVCLDLAPHCDEGKRIPVAEISKAIQCTPALVQASVALLLPLDKGDTTRDDIYIPFQMLYRAYGLTEALQSYSSLARLKGWKAPAYQDQEIAIQLSTECVSIYNHWLDKGFITQQIHSEALTKAEATIARQVQ